MEECKTADIVVACAGVPGLVTRDWLKEGCVVVDVGVHKVQNGDEASAPSKLHVLCGDVSFDDVVSRVSKITPVPGKL